MKNEHINCDPSLLSLFFDQELPPAEHERVIVHLKDCPACRKELRDIRAVSSMFRAGLENNTLQAGLLNIERSVIDRIKRKKEPWWNRFSNILTSRKFVIYAAGAAAMLVISVSGIRHSAIEAGPSAIVDSFTGETSSVMIMETPESQHTIIWFNEDS